MSLLDINPGSVEYPISTSDIVQRTTEPEPSGCMRPDIILTPKSDAPPLNTNTISEDDM
jgi:hypothetical protein